MVIGGEMKEITIAKGVKLVFEEDCHTCKLLKREVERLDNLMEEKDREIEHLYKLPERKERDYGWDKGFNHCLDLIFKHRNNV